ncbi:MAG: ATP-dependent helicase HrpB [Acidimicrobiia bacterium]
MSGADSGTAASLDAALPALRSALAPEGGSAVLVAPPGTGKTTIVPLALLDEPWAATGRILVLEPRRLATRAAARRMAWLRGEEVGDTVGFRTRDERRVGPRTRIEVVTEGILTRRLQRDPELPGVALVVFDEVHERNLQTDLGMAFALAAKRAIRPGLRILAMSATIDAGRLAALLGDEGSAVPVIEAGGRPHHVDVRWFPKKPNVRLEPAIVTVIETALRREEGDALVFLPGAGEITRVAQQLESAGLPDAGVDVRPLFGMLPAAEQDAALQPSPPGRRRVVLATDIAETSLTVEGVRIVIDSGLARAPRFDVRTGLTRLQTVSISKASAEQRAGRAGRTAPGVVYRLWSKGEHATRRAHNDAEILQVDLAGFALELAAWGTDDATSLAFLDPPPQRTLAEARDLLVALAAVDVDGRITPLGRSMNDLPLHPRLARMVAVSAESAGETDAILACALAALLEERDVLRGRPDEVPTDIALRLALLADPGTRHASADGRAVGGARRRARELASRAGIDASLLELVGAVPPTDIGRVLSLAYPDRLAVRRSQVGRFQLRSGTGVWVPKGDPLGQEPFLVVADLDGDRCEARIRMAAPIDADDVTRRFGEAVEERTVIVWQRDRDELVERVERRLGGMVLDEITRKPQPGDAVTALLLERVRDAGLRVLPWNDESRSLRARVAFLHRVDGDPWPDWSDAALLASLDEWLAPFLLFATGRADLDRLDLAGVLRAKLDHRLQQSLDSAAPTHITVPSGRRVRLDYEGDGDAPILAVAVQEMFGSTTTPTIGRNTPVVLHLLSPAGRPMQITRDLSGFWTGSWKEVRKEMAGRYPKHAWPVDPAAATPPRRDGNR